MSSGSAISFTLMEPQRPARSRPHKWQLVSRPPLISPVGKRNEKKQPMGIVAIRPPQRRLYFGSDAVWSPTKHRDTAVLARIPRQSKYFIPSVCCTTVAVLPLRPVLSPKNVQLHLSTHNFTPAPRRVLQQVTYTPSRTMPLKLWHWTRDYDEPGN